MQLLLSDVAGTPFPAIASETVLDPIGMSDSTFEQPLPEAHRDRAATGYRTDGTPVEGRWHVYPEMAAAGLWTTPSDFARYVIAVQKSRAGAEGAFLPAGLAEEMLTPVLEGHGLGPTLQANGTRFAHGGANEGYRAVFTAFLGRDEGAVIMANSDSAGPLLRELLITIAREYDWPGIQPMVKEIVDLGESVYGGLEGTYAIEGAGKVTIDYTDGELWADVPGGQRVELLPESDTVFFMRPDGRPVVFTREGDTITGFESAGLRARKVE
jgi:CubicO group peptidase (beta-lactamase class C family)